MNNGALLNRPALAFTLPNLADDPRSSSVIGSSLGGQHR